MQYTFCAHGQSQAANTHGQQEKPSTIRSSSLFSAFPRNESGHTYHCSKRIESCALIALAPFRSCNMTSLHFLRLRTADVRPQLVGIQLENCIKQLRFFVAMSVQEEASQVTETYGDTYRLLLFETRLSLFG